MRGIDPDDALDLYLGDQHARRYRGRLATAPDCRDPDHPGCPDCETWGDEPLPHHYDDEVGA